MGKQKYPSTVVKTSDGSTAVKKGREHYSHAKADARKDKRRQEAEARQVVYDNLPIEDKLNRAILRGGSKRELDRLYKIQKDGGVKPAVAPQTETVAPVKPKQNKYKKKHNQHVAEALEA